jgi:hypothetical protein
MQFRQSINLNDLQYNILGLDGVIGIKELSLFQSRGPKSDYAANRNMASFQGDGDSISGGESGYGFQYEFDGALVDGIIKPSVTPSVFELKNPNQDIYGKVI